MQACIKNIRQRCAEGRKAGVNINPALTVSQASDIHFMADMTSICRRIGHQYGTPGMEQCISENRQKFLQGGDWRTLLKTSEKLSISQFSVEELKRLRADILCAATRAELGYRPTANIFNEVKRRNLNCENLTVLTQKEREAASSIAREEASQAEFEKCMSDVSFNALQCGLGCWGQGNTCRQVCDDRKIAQKDRCEARLKGIQHQYNAPIMPTPSAPMMQQPQQIINPNVCIQDGGGKYCPNHPNTRRRYP